MGVGKTWCANYLEVAGWRRYSLANKLKSLALELYGIKDKSDRSRRVLQELGMDIRKHDNDVWIKYLLKRINFDGSSTNATIDDVRFVNEAKWLRENGFILVQVTCDESVRQQRIANLYPDASESRHQHQSEVEWKEIEPDFVIDSSDPAVAIDIERMLQNVTYRPSRQEQSGKNMGRKLPKREAQVHS